MFLGLRVDRDGELGLKLNSTGVTGRGSVSSVWYLSRGDIRLIVEKRTGVFLGRCVPGGGSGHGYFDARGSGGAAASD